MEKKYLNLRGISEILSEKEMRNVVGASGGGTGSGFYPCCRCDVTAYFCDDYGYPTNEADHIVNGLFCGSTGQVCHEIIQSWREFYSNVYCGASYSVCTQIS